MFVKLIFFIIFVLTFEGYKVNVIASADISCKDENGNFIDWFYAYKLPATYPSLEEDKGLTFIYITANSKSPKLWSLSSKLINDPSSIIGHTILQSFDVSNRIIVAYNDEPPTAKPKALNGHTKGIVVADNKSGFWLIHSVPLFPDLTKNFAYPQTGRTYGQSFLCISVNSSQVDKIGKQLIYNEPDIYFNITGNFHDIYSNLNDAIAGKRIRNPPYWNIETISSIYGVPFKSFAKNRYFDKELYEDWVAQTLNIDLYVETWRHGTGIIPSECPQQKRCVWNVSQIKMTQLQFDFNSTDDHSKWAVTSDYTWICVGDINRADHQKKRGGGTVCQQSIVAEAYSSLIKTFEPCQ